MLFCRVSSDRREDILWLIGEVVLRRIIGVLEVESRKYKIEGMGCEYLRFLFCFVYGVIFSVVREG